MGVKPRNLESAYTTTFKRNPCVKRGVTGSKMLTSINYFGWKFIMLHLILELIKIKASPMERLILHSLTVLPKHFCIHYLTAIIKIKEIFQWSCLGWDIVDR